MPYREALKSEFVEKAVQSLQMCKYDIKEGAYHIPLIGWVEFGGGGGFGTLGLGPATRARIRWSRRRR